MFSLWYIFIIAQANKKNTMEPFDFRINHKYVNSSIYGPHIYHLSIIYLFINLSSIICLSNNDLSVLC